MERFNSGIYQIVNLINGKKYIGSAVNLKNRKKEHRQKLKKNIHHNKHLQNAYNKYGKENFKFEIIMHCSAIKEHFKFFEQKHVDKYNLKTELYNKRKKVDSNIGLKHTKESKKNMSNAQQNRKPMSNETKEKLRQANLGKKMTKEHKEKLRQSNLGRKWSKEIKEKISKANKGKHLTEKHKKKLSEARIGYVHSEETKNKIRKANSGKNNPMYGKPGTNKGKHFTKEHKQKISEAQKGEKGYWFGKKGKNNPTSKPIKAFIYETGEFVGKFESTKKCAEILNLNKANISSVLNRKRNHHYGYTFEFINEKDKA